MRTLAVLVAITVAWISPVRADTFVNRCGTDVEGGGQNLASALASGGRIRFACPGGAATIIMTRDHELPPGTDLDGEGKIVLDAQNRRLRMFHVAAGGVSVRNLTIQNVRHKEGLARTWPSILDVDAGELRLDNVVIANSASPIKTLRATVTFSSFSDNTGSALSVTGTGLVRDSVFRSNDGGLSLSGGRVERAQFINNRSSGLSIRHPDFAVEVVGNWFYANAGRGAVVLSQRSNSSGGTQTIRFRRNVFENNVSATDAGAVSIIDTVAEAPSVAQPALSQFPPSKFEFSYDRFIRNRGQIAGAIGGSLSNTLGIRIQGGIFDSNMANSHGGAVGWTHAPAVGIFNSVFVENSAPDGAALFGDYKPPGARWVVSNSVFTRNSADPNGGIIAVGPIELLNVTVARNTGIGFTGDVHGSPPDWPLIANSIISENLGGNCRGVAPNRFRGRNLQFGAGDCEGVEVADPGLDDYLIPQLGSPALSIGDLEICRGETVGGRDIVFHLRGLRGSCAIGAFEYTPKDRLNDIFRQTER